MTNSKISALTSATTPLAGTEVLPIVQSGATVQVANNDLRPKQIQSNATSGVLQVAGPAAAATRVMTTPDANFTVARTDAGNAFTGNQTISGTLAAGGAAVTGYQFRFTGSYSSTIGAGSYGFAIDNTIAPPVGGYDASNAYIAGVLTKPTGGALTDATGLLLGAPTINGSGTATRGTTLRIINAPTGATTNRAFWVQAGASEFGADVTLTSANLIQGTAAKGVNFTANTPAAGMTSQLLNWYEEGTWTPNQGAGLTVVGAFSSAGTYTRIGRQVFIRGSVSGATSVAVASAGDISTNLPYSSAADTTGAAINAANNSSSVIRVSSVTLTAATAIAATATITFSAVYSV